MMSRYETNLFFPRDHSSPLTAAQEEQAASRAQECQGRVLESPEHRRSQYHLPSGRSQPLIPQPVPVPVPHPPPVVVSEPPIYTLPLPAGPSAGPSHPLSPLQPPFSFSPPPSPPAAAASSHATSPAPSTIPSRMSSPAIDPLHISDDPEPEPFHFSDFSDDSEPDPFHLSDDSELDLYFSDDSEPEHVIVPVPVPW